MCGGWRGGGGAAGGKTGGGGARQGHVRRLTGRGGTVRVNRRRAGGPAVLGKVGEMAEAPRLLLLETSGRGGFVAAAEGPALRAVRRLDEARRHARDLAPATA